MEDGENDINVLFGPRFFFTLLSLETLCWAFTRDRYLESTSRTVFIARE